MIDLLASRSFGPAEVKDARARLDLSHADLAERYGVSVHRVREWEDGTARVPRRVAKYLVWEVAVAERDEAFAATGVEPCDWQSGWEEELVRIRLDHEAVDRHLETLDRHRDACESCRARVAWEEKQPPLPDEPVEGWIMTLFVILERVHRLPAWLRPAAYGAVFVGAITFARAAVALLVSGPSLALVWMALQGIVLGATLGAAGGGTYALVREPFRRLGRAGDYLTGIVCVGAYMGGFLVLGVLTGDPEFAEPSMWGAFAFCTLLFGPYIGHIWFREA